MEHKQENASLNFALIGCGRISQTYLQAIVSVPECRLKGVSDIRKEAAQSVADQYGCRAYSDFRQVLEGNRIDAVIISTPPNTHAEIATFFLENGIHVLCEKPFALNSKDAGLMVRKAEEKGCLLMMASKFRYVEDIIKAKGIVKSGILGDIILFENVFCSKVDMRARWNAEKEIAGGGVLIDNGSHSVDIARFLLGPIVKVQAEEGKRVQKLEVEDTSRLYFRTESDIIGAVDLSWSIHKEQESYIDLYGTEGVLSIGWKCSKYRQSEKLNWVRFGNGYDKISAFERQIKNFVGTIKGVEMPLINATDGLESVKVIEAAYRSANVNKWVEVES
ncbi:MAG: Gfo/Idh/MocA family protein [Candidatus Hodarchaeota archaeon]